MIRDTSAQDTVLSRPAGARRRRWLLAAAGLALLAATGLSWSSWQRWADTDRAYPLARLRLGEASRGEFLRDVAVQGQIVAAHSPTLYAPATGLAALAVQAGDRVVQGQILARIASPELNSELEREAAALQSLDTELARARIDARQKLFEAKRAIDLARISRAAALREQRRADDPKLRQAYSQLEYEAQRDAVEKTGIELANAEEQHRLLKENLAFEEQTRAHRVEGQRLAVAELKRRLASLVLRSPVDGLVGSLAVAQQALVAANAPVMTVVDLSAYAAELEVPEAYADDLAVGMAAELSVNGRSHAGEISALSPEVKDNRVLARVRWSGAAPEGLRQNQRLSARIVLEARAGVLTVPRGAFLEEGAGRIAYVVAQGVAQKRAITTGASSVGAVEVLSGLKPGERIVLSSTREFEDAERVALTD